MIYQIWPKNGDKNLLLRSRYVCLCHLSILLQQRKLRTATRSCNQMGACWDTISVNDRRMLNNEILPKTFRFLVKKLVRNIFWDTQKGLEFQSLSKLYFIDNTVTNNNKKTLSKLNLLKLCQNIYLLNICWYQKLTSKLEPFKNFIFGGLIWGPPGGGILELCQNICLINIYW